MCSICMYILANYACSKSIANLYARAKTSQTCARAACSQCHLLSTKMWWIYQASNLHMLEGMPYNHICFQHKTELIVLGPRTDLFLQQQNYKNPFKRKIWTRQAGVNAHELRNSLLHLQVDFLSYCNTGLACRGQVIKWNKLNFNCLNRIWNEPEKMCSEVLSMQLRQHKVQNNCIQGRGSQRSWYAKKTHTEMPGFQTTNGTNII